MDAEPAVVEHHLRRLSTGALTALVADLWAARGFETRQEGDVVVATRDTRTVVLAVLGSDAAGPAPVHRVDAVVAPGAGRATAAAAADHGTRLFDAAELRKTLWYAVDRETTRALCERHLGTAPGDLRPSPRSRLVAPLADRLSTPIPASVRTASGLARAATFVVVLVAAAGLLAVVGLALVDGGAGSAATDAPSTPGRTPAAVPTATPGPVLPGRDPVPGLTAGGLTDPAALTSAHDRALGERYTVWLDVYWVHDPTSDWPWRQRDVDVAVDGDRYLLEARVEGEMDRWLVLSVYRDGATRRVATYENQTARYRTLPPGADSPAWVPEPAVLRRTVVSRYLATPETNVTGVVEEDGRTYYRVVGTGHPPSAVPGPDGRTVAPADVGDYTVVALVARQGFVADLDARYTVPGDHGRVPVRFQVTYGARGRTTVGRPAWAERPVANGTPPSGTPVGR